MTSGEEFDLPQNHDLRLHYRSSNPQRQLSKSFSVYLPDKLDAIGAKGCASGVLALVAVVL